MHNAASVALGSMPICGVAERLAVGSEHRCRLLPSPLDGVALAEKVRFRPNGQFRLQPEADMMPNTPFGTKRTFAKIPGMGKMRDPAAIRCRRDPDHTQCPL